MLIRNIERKKRCINCFSRARRAGNVGAGVGIQEVEKGAALESKPQSRAGEGSRWTGPDFIERPCLLRSEAVGSQRGPSRRAAHKLVCAHRARARILDDAILET